MKKLLLLLILIFSGMCFSTEENWLKGPDSRWFIKLEPALKQAEKENKFVYVLKTGSDWCGFCKVLLKNVLNKKLFAEFAQKHLVLVYLDLPGKRVNMPQEQRDYNRMTTSKLRMSGGVPNALLLKPDGTRVGVLSGYSWEGLYISNLYKTLKIPGCPKFPAAADISLKSSKNYPPAKVRVNIVAWGTSRDRINNPLTGTDMTNMPPNKKIFFKVVYTLPAGLRANLTIKDTESNIFVPLNKKVTRSGTYIFSAFSPARQGYWGSATAPFRAIIAPYNKNYRPGAGSINCRVKLDPGLLNEQERSELVQKNEQLRESFKKSKFEIISWSHSRETENLYDPEEGIRVAPRKVVFVKIQYSLPGPAGIGISSRKNPYVRNYVHRAAGEYTLIIRGYGAGGSQIKL